MVEVSNAFKTECEVNVGTYKFGKVKVNLINNNPTDWEVGEYSSSDGTKEDTANMARFASLVKCEASKKYNISLSNSNYKMRVTTFNSSQAYVATHDNLVDGNEITTAATAAYLSATIWETTNVYSGTSLYIENADDTKIDLELQGNTTQNGTPTPTSPVEVKTVTGEQKVTILGQNFYNVNDRNSVTTGVTIDSSDWISVTYDNTSGSSTKIFNCKMNPSTLLKTDTNYRMFFEVASVTGTGKLTINEGNSNSAQFKTGATYNFTDFSNNGVYYKDVTTWSSIDSRNNFFNQYIYFTTGQSGSIKFRVSVVADTTLSTSNFKYEAYRSVAKSINLASKNFIPMPSTEASQTINGVALSYEGNGTYKISGQMESSVVTAKAFDIEEVTIPAGTYYWHLRNTGTTTGSIVFAIQYGSTTKAYIGFNPNNRITSVTFNEDTKINKTQLYIGNTFGTSTEIDITLQPSLEKTNSTTDFMPYYTPIELCKIGTYQDKIVKNNGKWYIEKNIGKKILTNSSGWSAISGTTYYSYNCPLGDTATRTDTTALYYSNYFKAITTNARYQDQTFFINAGNRVVVSYNDKTTLNDFNLWIKDNNLKVYYVLANPTYTLIENEELLNQLESVKLLVGTNNIEVIGDLPAIMDASIDLSQYIGSQEVKPYAGFNITGDDDLISYKITAKADRNGKPLGSVVTKQLDLEVFNENNKYDLENKQVQVSTGLAETSGNYCEWETFNITQTKDTQTKGHAQYTGYDNMMKASVPYADENDYGETGISLYEYARQVVKQLGCTLGNETLPNGDHVVTGNPFTNNETLETVLKQLGELNGSFVEIGRDDKVWFRQIENSASPIALSTNLYTEDFSKSAKFGGVNKVAVGESNIETNAAIESDADDIALNGEYLIEVLDNYFMITMEQKEATCELLWEQLEGFLYYPFKTKYNGFPYLDLGDGLTITDINNNTYTTLVLNYDFIYSGGYAGNVGASALSKTESKYKNKNTLGKAFRKVGIEVDRVEGKITQEVTAMSDDLTTAYSGAIETSEENIMGQVKTIQTTLYGPEESPEEGLTKIVETHSTQIEATSSFVNVDIKNKLDTTYDMADAVTNNTKEIIESFNFSEDGMLITNKGSETADMALLVSNAAIIFKHRGNNVLVINGEKIEFSAVSFQKLDLGNYVWQAEQDDSLSLIYEGGNT